MVMAQRRRAGGGRAGDRRLPSHHALGRNPYRRRGGRHHRLGRRRGPAACRPARRRRAAGTRGLRLGRRAADRDRRAARARAPAPRPAGGRRRHARRRAGAPGRREQARRARSACRSRRRRRASSACWSRTCCMPSNGSASSAGTTPRPSPWWRPAAPARCMAPPWRAPWAAGGRCCRARPAPSAPWACCSPTCGRIICRSSWPISTRSIAPPLEAGFAQLEATRPRRAGPRRFRRDDAAVEREVDLRYEGQQWPVRVALGRAGFDAARRAPGVRGRAPAPVRPYPARRPHRHHRPSRRRPRPPRLAAAGRHGHASRPCPSRARTRKVWIDAARGWSDVPIYDGADLAARLPARRAAADRGAHHDRLRRSARRARGRSPRRFPGPYRSRRMKSRARSRDPGAGAEPAGPHLAPDGLGDDAHGALADLQPEPRFLLLHRRRARHPDQPGRRHSHPYRRRRLRRARHPARLQGRDRSRGRVPAERSLHRGRQSPARLGDRAAGVRRPARWSPSPAIAPTRPTSAAARRAPTTRRPPRSSTKASGCRC